MRNKLYSLGVILMAMLSTACMGVENGDSVGRATAALLPGKTDLISPIGSMSSNPVSFVWHSLQSATRYELRVEREGVVVFDQDITADEAGCADYEETCSYSVTMAEGNSLAWVRGENAEGDGEWSDSVAFSLSVTGTAALVWPAGNTAAGELGYVWTEVVGAVTYTILIERDGVAWKSYTIPALTTCEDGLCHYSTSHLHDEAGYVWKVRVDSGDWSLESEFTVSGSPTVQLITPVGSVHGSSAVFMWKPLPGADHTYRVWVSNADPDAESAFHDVTYTAAQAGCENGEGICSIGLLTGLPAGATQWVVQADGDDTLYSNYGTFVVEL